MLEVPAAATWRVVEGYTRSEYHVFSTVASERQEGDHRVVTLPDGEEIWERNVTVDAEHMRAAYTIPGLLGAEHHHASMQVFAEGDGRCRLVWITDFLPHELVEGLREAYDGLFADLVSAVTRYARQ